jgi:hypothetical protein
LGIAACDDDTTSGGGEMGAGMDLSASAGPDMAGNPGNGQLTLADVVGTVFSPTKGPLPRTHTLVAVASLPKVAGTPDPSSDFSVTPSIHGCSIYRYTATNPPGADGDAGNVTMSGFATTYLIGANAVNGSLSPGPMAGTSPITCTRNAMSMLYDCKYGGMNSPDSGASGSEVGQVVFPVVPAEIGASAAGPFGPIPPAMGGWPYRDLTGAELGCVLRGPLPNPDGSATFIKVCEQQPIIPLGVSTITQTISGGADWPAASQMLGNGGGTDGGAGQLPGPLYLVSVKSGTTEIAGMDALTGGNDLSMANGAIDPAKDLVITYSCDPNNLTAAAGCAGAQDLVGLLVTTSTSKKSAFGVSTATGTGTCSQGVATPGGTITVKTAQLTALLGGQTGGSWQIALVRLKAQLMSPAGNHQLLAYTAGMGIFGFTNQ